MAADRRDFRQPVTLGRTGLRVSRLGVGASYGVGAAALERAFHERGVNSFYWGSRRTRSMRDAIRNLLSVGRARLVIAFQSYDRTGRLMRLFHERGLKALGVEYADVLILGWYNSVPAGRILDAALRLKDEGKVRCLALSGHNRPLFGELARRSDAEPYDIFMFRYNAAHTGAERDIFPHLPEGESRPGTIAYTATRWGQLLQQQRMPAGERPLSAAECYRFALSRPEVDLCLTGPATDEQMDEALRALDAGPLSEEELARARRIGEHVRSKRSVSVAGN
jgi:aryl-alcohol dehydrogenase-like predicted oxidoreductase